MKRSEFADIETPAGRMNRFQRKIRMKKWEFPVLFFTGMLVFALASAVSGQISGNVSVHSHTLGINLAGLHTQVKDELIAPIRWDGAGVGLGFSYIATARRSEHEIDFVFPVSFLSDRYDHQAYAWSVLLEYTGLRRIRSSFLKGSLYLGGSIGWNAGCQYYADWDDSHLYWLGVYHLGPSLKWSRSGGMKGHLSVAVQMPLFALVSRPPENQYFDQARLTRPGYYFEALHSDLKPVTLDDYISFTFKAEYRIRPGSGSSLGCAWIFHYSACNFPENIRLISNSIRFSYFIGL